MPRDQTSTLPSYWPSSMARITSGAIQYGVPTKEFAGHLMDALPKSASFTVPFSVSNMLPAFTSLERTHRKDHGNLKTSNCSSEKLLILLYE